LAVRKKTAKEGLARGVTTHQLWAAGGVSLGVVINGDGHLGKCATAKARNSVSSKADLVASAHRS